MSQKPQAKAAFNSVPFSVQSLDRSGGRRLAIHELPLRDRPVFEDLGRKNNEFSIEALLVGDDREARRDQLIAELDKPGVGELKHPLLGTLPVVVRDWNLTESYNELGKIVLQISFLEAGELTHEAASPKAGLANNAKLAPLVQRNISKDQVLAAADAVEAAAQAYVDTVVAPQIASWVTTLAAQANGVIDALNAQAQALAAQLESWCNQLQGWLDANLITPLAAVLHQLQALKNDLQALMALPGELARRLRGIVASLRALFKNNPLHGFSVSLKLSLQGLKTEWAALKADWDELRHRPRALELHPASNPASADPDRPPQAAAMSLLQVSLGLTAAAALATEVSFASRDEALRLRDDWLAAAEQLETLAPDALYGVLRELRAALMADIASRATELPELAHYTLVGSQPSLVLAYQLYADPTRADELVTRNGIVRHPGFLPGGQPLEVLQ